MRYESSNKRAPGPPLCPSCAQIMRLARTTSRFDNLPDLYVFECRGCGVSHIEAAFCDAPPCEQSHTRADHPPTTGN
jgi:hypothetical protein